MNVQDPEENDVEVVVTGSPEPGEYSSVPHPALQSSLAQAGAMVQSAMGDGDDGPDKIYRTAAEAARAAEGDRCVRAVWVMRNNAVEASQPVGYVLTGNEIN